MSATAGERIRLLPARHHHDSPAGSAEYMFSFPVAVAFSLNYIMGTGFLTLPWAFSKTGYLSFLVMGLIIAPALVAIVMVLEVMARAEKYTEVFMKTEDGDYEVKDGVDLDDLDFSGQPRLRVKKKKFELVELCNMFLGPFFQLGYLCFLGAYTFGLLWAYGTVFAKAFEGNLPIFGDYSYVGYVVVFGVLVIPLSCLDLKEQLTVQLILSAGRVLMVIFMVSTIAVSYFWGSEDDFGAESLKGKGELFALRTSGLQHLLPIATFANIFHYAIPALSQPVANKSKLAYIFITTLGCCFLAYSAIALSVSLYFGSNTLSSSNLNWVDYGNNCSGLSHAVRRFIAVYVVMFPAFDVASAFPLNAVTMGNNLFSVVYGKNVHNMEDSKKHKISFRLLAAIPPLIMAALESSLGKITDYTGISGFALAFIFPPLLAYYSHTTLADNGMPVNTIYSGVYSSQYSGALIMIFGVCLLIYVPYLLMFYDNNDF